MLGDKQKQEVSEHPREAYQKKTNFVRVSRIYSERSPTNRERDKKEYVKMQVERMKVAPVTVAYADGEQHKLVVEFAIPGAPTDTIDVKILNDSVYLLAPARDIEYVSALALTWPVKPEKAEATYENGLLRIEVPFKDPMEDAVKVVIKAGGAETKIKTIVP